METKRLFFPRFYFVSSADLLDILSIGNQPKLVLKHLTKLFDSVARLELILTEAKEYSALGMYAKDGEYVVFDMTSECVGPVEGKDKNILNKTNQFLKHLFLTKFG